MPKSREGRISIPDTEAGPILGVAVQTLRNWRSKGAGPIYFRVGARAIRYDVEDLQRYIDARKVRPRI